MPDDVGGQPFPDGEEPEYRHHGGADDEFASVVLDEDFVRAAEVHEPTAIERILAATQQLADVNREEPGEDSARPEDETEDDEGRFDRSDYREYIDLSDPGDPGWHRGYGPYGIRGLHDDDATPYGRRDGGHPDGPPEAGKRPPGHGWDPSLDADEHGSDHRYGSPYRPAAWRSRKWPHNAYGPHGAYREHPYRGHVRWQRPVAWVLAVIMGIGVVALAMSAVYRGGSGERRDPQPPRPATSGVDSQMRTGAQGQASGPRAGLPDGRLAPLLAARAQGG